MICKFFLEGNCRFGSRCYNEHILEDPKPKQKKGKNKNRNRSRKNKAQVKCTICLEVPKDCHRPENCSHEFCFNCIVKWEETNDTCPVCREPFGDLVPVQKASNSRNLGTDNVPNEANTRQASQRNGVNATGSSRVGANSSISHTDYIHTRVQQSIREDYSRGSNSVNYTYENEYYDYHSEADSDDQASFYYCVYCGNESIEQVGISCRFCGIEFGELSDRDRYSYNSEDYRQQKEQSNCRDCGIRYTARSVATYCYCGTRNEARATRHTEETRNSNSSQSKETIYCPVCLISCERLPGIYRCHYCGGEYDRLSSDNDNNSSRQEVDADSWYCCGISYEIPRDLNECEYYEEKYDFKYRTYCCRRCGDYEENHNVAYYCINCDADLGNQ